MERRAHVRKVPLPMAATMTAPFPQLNLDLARFARVFVDFIWACRFQRRVDSSFRKRKLAAPTLTMRCAPLLSSHARLI